MQSCVWKKRPKNTSGGPSGDPFWDPKSPQIDVGGTELAKISGKKVDFWTVRFLTVFSSSEKNGKN